MSYKDEFIKAKDKGKVTQVTHAIHKWSEPGEELIGVVKEVTLFDKSVYETECNAYLLDTDEGLVSTVLGAAADSALKSKDIVGHIIRIEYKGKVEIGEGRRANQFEIELL